MTRDEKMEIQGNLLKRFFLEKGYNDGSIEDVFLSDIDYQEEMYNRFLNGKIEIKSIDFDEWLKNYTINNSIFGKALKSYSINRDEKITELSESEVYSVSRKGCLYRNSSVIETIAGKDYTYKPNNTIDLTQHLICNGVYPNEMVYLSRIAREGRFSVGYCGDRENGYGREILAYYRCLKKSLMEMTKNQLKEVNTIIYGRKVYILTYNPNFVVPEKEKQIVKKISQR